MRTGGAANQPFERQAALFDRVHPEYGKGGARRRREAVAAPNRPRPSNQALRPLMGTGGFGRLFFPGRGLRA